MRKCKWSCRLSTQPKTPVNTRKWIIRWKRKRKLENREAPCTGKSFVNFPANDSNYVKILVAYDRYSPFSLQLGILEWLAMTSIGSQAGICWCSHRLLKTENSLKTIATSLIAIVTQRANVQNCFKVSPYFVSINSKLVKFWRLKTKLRQPYNNQSIAPNK